MDLEVIGAETRLTYLMIWTSGGLYFSKWRRPSWPAEIRSHEGLLSI